MNNKVTDYDVKAQEVYFRAAWDNAVELCVYLCKLYALTERDIICHSEGYTKGVASNHGDVMHWFPMHGESMDTFREAVKATRNKEGNSMDNTPGVWAKEGVEWAIAKGLLKGDNYGDLQLREPITREQFCVILKRYDDLQGGSK